MFDCYFLVKPNKSGSIFFHYYQALGIVAEILFFLEKIAAKSPTLSFLRKGNAQIKWLQTNYFYFIDRSQINKLT